MSVIAYTIQHSLNTFISTEEANLGLPLLTDIIIDEGKIIEAISEISSSSAAGPDGMQAILLKECAKEISEPLQIVFRSMFDCHYIPDMLKRAAIVPIFKSGDKSQPANYHPISLTPIIMKILERIVRKQVVKFLTKNDYLNPTQHGFREGRSCLSALLDVYDDIVTL